MIWLWRIWKWWWIFVTQYNDLSLNNNKKLNINCRGHGCFYLNLYAINGCSDVNIKYFDGCQQCDSIDQCIQNWYMYCGSNYNNIAVFDGLECHTSQCDCPSIILDIHTKFMNNEYKDCWFVQPDIICKGELENTECIID